MKNSPILQFKLPKNKIKMFRFLKLSFNFLEKRGKK